MSIDIDKTLEDYKELRLIIIEERERVQQEVLVLLKIAKDEYNSKNWFMKLYYSCQTLITAHNLLSNVGIGCQYLFKVTDNHFLFSHRMLEAWCNEDPRLSLEDIKEEDISEDIFQSILEFVNWAKVYNRFVIKCRVNQ